MQGVVSSYLYEKGIFCLCHNLMSCLQCHHTNLTLCCCSVAKSRLTLWPHGLHSLTVFPVPRYLPEFAQMHVHGVGNAISPSHSLPPSSPFAFNVSQHQGLFQWVSSSHQVAKVLELQHQSFQWIFRVHFL